MKFKSISKLTLLAALLCGGANAAWADTTVVGAEDNSDGDYYTGDHNARYSVAAGKTITIQFTVSTATNEQLGGSTWNPWYAWALNFWDGTLNAITVEPRNYGWEANTENNRWTADWATYWAQNYPEGWETGTNFRDIIQGATVVATVKRVGSDVHIIYDITTTSDAKYRQYVVKSYGDGTKTIWFDLLVRHTHITIDNSKTETTDTESITGTLIGNMNRCTGFTSNESKKEDFVLEPNGTLNLTFRNYSAGVETWQSWMFEMLYNAKYCNMVAGNNNQWGELKSANGTFDNTNWPASNEILDKLEGALVNLTVARSGADVTVTAVHTPVTGDPFTLKYSFSSAEENFATSNVNVHLISDYGFLDLLPVTTTISSTGWSTFSSDYALDFSSVPATLKAYMITDHSGDVVTTSKVTGTVPAGTGLLLNGTASTSYNIPIVGSSDTNVDANLLVAGQGTLVTGGDNMTFVLAKSKTGDQAMFKKLDGTATIAKGKAYLKFKSAVTAPALFFNFGDVTGIDATLMNSEKRIANSVYDLQGRKVAQPAKGLYIVNGKKYVVK